MKTLVAIGEFSRLTHLSVTTLRHYHEVGLLEPAAIDPFSAYRRYDTEQAHTAQLIRRLRQLELPAARLAVARHDCCYTDSDLTYAAPGAYVAEHDTPADSRTRPEDPFDIRPHQLTP